MDKKTITTKDYWADKLRRRNAFLREMKRLQKIPKPEFVGTAEECIEWLNQ